MGLSGTSGPFSGAYQSWNIPVTTIPASTNSLPVWRYTVPAGMDLTIYNVQTWAKQGGGGAGATLNLFDDGTSILSSPVAIATDTASSGTLTATRGVTVAGGSVITATAFNAGSVAEEVLLTVLWAPTGNTHPNSVRSAYE
jgi:hypothetical protein